MECGVILQKRYQISSLIGRGQSGSVYLVKDLHLDKSRAIKCLEKEHSGKEIEILKALTHEGIPRITDAFWEGEKQCIVMEYVKGKTLKEWQSEKKQCEEGLALQWMLQLVEILKYLHENRPEILYLDLKLENIIVTPEGRVRLVDFGAAFWNTRKDDTKKSSYFGTVGYASPEQVCGSLKLDKRSDIYSLGAVMYCLITGSVPTQKVKQKESMRMKNASISKVFSTIIEKCLQEDKEKRFQTSEELLKALESISKNKVFEKITTKTVCYIHYLSNIGILLVSGIMAEQIWVERWEIESRNLIVLIILAVGNLLARMMLGSGKKSKIPYRVICNTLLTDKKEIGLLLLFFFLGFIIEFTIVSLNTKFEGVVWVADNYNRKILIKEGGRYCGDKDLIFEHRNKKETVLYQLAVQNGNWEEMDSVKLQIIEEDLKKEKEIEVSFREIDFSGKRKKICRQNFKIVYEKKEPKIAISAILGESYIN